MADQGNSELARAVQEITERAELLVREEIALAKAEMTEKAARGCASVLSLLSVLPSSGLTAVPLRQYQRTPAHHRYRHHDAE